MQIDAFGRVIDINAPETVGCTACGGSAEHLSSAWQGEGIVYHHYLCRDECPAGGAIVEHENGDERRVGSIFSPPRSHHPPRRAARIPWSRVFDSQEVRA